MFIRTEASERYVLDEVPCRIVKYDKSDPRAIVSEAVSGFGYEPGNEADRPIFRVARFIEKLIGYEKTCRDAASGRTGPPKTIARFRRNIRIVPPVRF